MKDCINDTVDETALKKENLEKISFMRNFKENWNGHNSLPFSEEAINLFSYIIENTDKQPFISPTGRESLLLQYELADLSYLGFEVFKNKITKVYIPQRNYDDAVEKTVYGDFIEFINSNLERFYRDDIACR